MRFLNLFSFQTSSNWSQLVTIGQKLLSVLVGFKIISFLGHYLNFTYLLQHDRSSNSAMSAESGTVEPKFTNDNKKPSSLVFLADETRPCHGLRVDLKRCLLVTDCCTIRKKTPLACLKEGDVPSECIALKNAFFECKRSLLDMRTRFRGRKGYWWVLAQQISKMVPENSFVSLLFF